MTIAFAMPAGSTLVRLSSVDLVTGERQESCRRRVRLPPASASLFSVISRESRNCCKLRFEPIDKHKPTSRY